jgi:hypothetical protein
MVPRAMLLGSSFPFSSREPAAEPRNAAGRAAMPIPAKRLGAIIPAMSGKTMSYSLAFSAMIAVERCLVIVISSR